MPCGDIELDIINQAITRMLTGGGPFISNIVSFICLFFTFGVVAISSSIFANKHMNLNNLYMDGGGGVV